MAASRNKQSADTDELLGVLRRSLASYIPQDVGVTVGLSGGIDSVVLLDALSCLLPAPRLAALHVHHGLSAHADNWAEFCQAFATERQIACVVQRVNVSSSGEGLEAAARQARFRVFAETGSPFIALAHHADDQAETVLFRLLRGTGVHGLAGMPVVRAYVHMTGGGRMIDQIFWRPLLGISRVSVLRYATARGLRWIEDESNTNQHFTRNFLRLSVLPLLQNRFPQTLTALGRAATHAEDAVALLDERALEDLRTCQSAGSRVVLQVNQLQRLSDARLRNMLRYWLKEVNWLAPEAATLDEWLSQLRLATTDSKAILSYPAGECRVWRGLLYRIHKSEPFMAAVTIDLTTLKQPGSVALAHGQVTWSYEPNVTMKQQVLILSYDQIEAAMRNRQTIRFSPRGDGGQYLKLAANRPSRSLKKHLQETDLPPWERDFLPLVYIGDACIGCFGVGVDVSWQPQAEHDVTITLIWHPANRMSAVIPDL